MKIAKTQQRRIKRWLAQRRKRISVASRKRKVRFISVLAGGIIFFSVTGMVVAFITVAYFAKDLPSPDQLTSRSVPQTTKIFSRDDVLLYEIYGDERRTLVSLDATAPIFL